MGLRRKLTDINLRTPGYAMNKSVNLIPRMRIRTESHKPRIIVRQLAAYKRHLDSFNHKAHLHWLNSSVYRYFGTDFFHDGAIEEFQFSPDFRTLSFRIMAPYIAHREDSSKSTYAWF